MLIENTTLEENDVIAMKTTNGEEVVAKFKSLTCDDIRVTKPFILAPTPQGIAMVPFMISLTDGAEITIDRASVVSHTKARKEVADAYTQQTSNIMTASNVDPKDLATLGQ